MIYRVQAYNTATASENKIHDDTVAARLGFGGGLVPGVDVYAYMTQPVVRLWGREWLRRGAISARFRQPVYDGERLSTRARVRDEYEKKEHRFVELDVLTVGANERPLLSVRHTAIDEPRQLRA
jgi:acyl dehydratase